jgi:hypothetical protein
MPELSLQEIGEVVEAARRVGFEAACAVKRLLLIQDQINDTLPSILVALEREFPTLVIRVEFDGDWLLDLSRTMHGLDEYADKSPAEIPSPGVHVWVLLGRGKAWICPWLAGRHEAAESAGRVEEGVWFWADPVGYPVEGKLPEVPAEAFARVCARLSAATGLRLGLTDVEREKLL